MDHNYPALLPPARSKGRSTFGGPSTHRPDYASQRPGSSNMPGSSGGMLGPERVRLKEILFAIFENWLPFTWPSTARFIGPRPQVANWQSPQDVDVAERIIRYGDYPSGSRPFPYPYMIGNVSGFCPLLDQYSLAFSWSKTPTGPSVLTPIPIPWDAQYPTLPKVTG